MRHHADRNGFCQSLVSISSNGTSAFVTAYSRIKRVCGSRADSPPAVWKKDLGIYGRRFTKEDSRSLALELFPELADELRRKKDHGRAESLLIAAWGLGYRYREEETEPAEPSVAPG